MTKNKSGKGIKMENLKNHIPDIVTGLLGMFIAFLVKPAGWSVTNALIWFAVFAVAYLVIHLLFMLPAVLRKQGENR
ncbi:hypothetical protein [Trueperella sp. LYQ143]|uniref:hypothetical protein n=1 Tax=Trueperella sp. LYQ143 TaxID=3391059 RepID=UPI0039830B84